MSIIQENINRLIKDRGMSKKEFASKLIGLKPTVSRIGEIPSISAIYSYLNGRINIPVDLISYIADILDVSEQEIFDTSDKARRKCFKHFFENVNKEELDFLKNFIDLKVNSPINIKYDETTMNLKNTNKKIDLFLNLLEYAPTYFIDQVLIRLKEYKKLSYPI